MYSDFGMQVSLVHSLLMFGWALLLFDKTVCCSDCSSALMSWKRCSSISLSINTAAVCEDFPIWPILSRRFWAVLCRFWYPFSSQKRLVSSITPCLRPFTFLGQSSKLWSCLAISLQCKRSTHILVSSGVFIFRHDGELHHSYCKSN